MSSYAPWKGLERREAKRQVGVRLWRPDYGDSIPDGETETTVWDAKVRASIAAITWFLDCERKYRTYTGNRNFHLALYTTAHPRSGDFVLCRAERYAHLCELERRAKLKGLV